MGVVDDEAVLVWKRRDLIYPQTIRATQWSSYGQTAGPRPVLPKWRHDSSSSSRFQGDEPWLDKAAQFPNHELVPDLNIVKEILLVDRG